MTKRVNFYRKIPPLVFITFLILSSTINQAQVVKRQCISSYSAIVSSNEFTISQTVGQPFGTANLNGKANSMLLGFQQPIVFKVENLKTEPLRDIKLDIYPNPATFSVAIQTEKLIENSIIQVVDISGNLMMSERVSQLSNYTINCETWANGTYIISIKDGYNTICLKKLLISK